MPPSSSPQGPMTLHHLDAVQLGIGLSKVELREAHRAGQRVEGVKRRQKGSLARAKQVADWNRGQELLMHGLADDTVAIPYISKPSIDTPGESQRRATILEHRARRNVVHSIMLHERLQANATDLDEPNKENAPPARPVHPGGLIRRRPIRLLDGKNDLTDEQRIALEVETRVLQGDTHAALPGTNTDLLRCICGGLEKDDEYTGLWVAGQQCGAWQHSVCVGAPMDQAVLAEKEYFCELCRPGDHGTYCEAMERAEEIWQKRISAFEAEKKRRIKERRVMGGLAMTLRSMSVNN